MAWSGRPFRIASLTAVLPLPPLVRRRWDRQGHDNPDTSKPVCRASSHHGHFSSAPGKADIGQRPIVEAQLLRRVREPSYEHPWGDRVWLGGPRRRIYPRLDYTGQASLVPLRQPSMRSQITLASTPTSWTRRQAIPAVCLQEARMLGGLTPAKVILVCKVLPSIPIS